MTAFELTPTEISCGVSMSKVEETAARAYVTGDGHVVVDQISPALSGAAARLKAGGPATFSHLVGTTLAVYRT